jgi:hypothetical protein
VQEKNAGSARYCKTVQDIAGKCTTKQHGANTQQFLTAQDVTDYKFGAFGNCLIVNFRVSTPDGAEYF